MEVSPRYLLGVVDQPLVAAVERHLPALLAQLPRGGDHDDAIEAGLAARLVEQRHLGDADLRRRVQSAELLAPQEVLPRDERMQETLEKREGGIVAENDRRDPGAIGRSVLAEDLLTEPLHEGGSNAGVGREQVVDDLVARHRGGTVRAERSERGALPGTDSTRDRDSDRARQLSR